MRIVHDLKVDVTKTSAEAAIGNLGGQIDSFTQQPELTETELLTIAGVLKAKGIEIEDRFLLPRLAEEEGIELE